MFGTYRMLLALMVVALHLGGLPILGGYAVFGFYILSGYLMTLIMQERYGYRPAGLWRYAVNRFLRLYPSYWVAIALSILLILILGEPLTRGYQADLFMPQTWTDWGRNLAIFLFYDRGPRLSPPAWALTVELFFYLLIGLGLSRTWRLTLAWVCLSALYHVAVVAFALGDRYQYFSFAAASLPFSTGALIYHAKASLLRLLNAWLSARFRLYLPIILLAGMLVNWGLGLWVNQPRGFFFYGNFLICALMVMALSETEALPGISARADRWMGSLSYPIYLLHYQAGLIVVALLSQFGLAPERAIPSWGVTVLALPLMVAIAALLTLLIERPIEHIRRRIKRQNFEQIQNLHRSRMKQ